MRSGSRFDDLCVKDTFTRARRLLQDASGRSGFLDTIADRHEVSTDQRDRIVDDRPPKHRRKSCRLAARRHDLRRQVIPTEVQSQENHAGTESGSTMRGHRPLDQRYPFISVPLPIRPCQNRHVVKNVAYKCESFLPVNPDTSAALDDRFLKALQALIFERQQPLPASASTAVVLLAQSSSLGVLSRMPASWTCNLEQRVSPISKEARPGSIHRFGQMSRAKMNVHLGRTDLPVSRKRFQFEDSPSGSS